MNLRSAAAEVHLTVRRREERGGRSPFFLMVGAGISSPPIPLASQIELACRAEAEKQNRWTAAPSGASALEQYSHSFDCAYSQRGERQRYLRDLMGGKPISPANFRLAHLLLGKKLFRIVVTTNFDDLLARALTLFGSPPIVCDHPLLLERFDDESDDIQIVHLHGSLWFYDCCNLKGEMAGRAADSDPTRPTMLTMLANLLEHHSPIVAGYSGWDGDVFMTALHRRLVSRPLATNLYWFCYTRAEANELPPWLQDHSNVRIVLPPKAAREGTRPDEAHMSVETSEPVLDAGTVFSELIKFFKPGDLPLIDNPIEFFEKHLRDSLLIHDDPTVPDPYSLRSVIEKVQKAAKGAARPDAVEKQLEEFRNAVRSAQHREAIRLGGSLPLAAFSPEQRREVFGLLTNLSAALDASPADQIAACDLIVAVGDTL